MSNPQTQVSNLVFYAQSTNSIPTQYKRNDTYTNIKDKFSLKKQGKDMLGHSGIVD